MQGYTIQHSPPLSSPPRKGEYIDTGSDCVLHQPPKNTTTLPPHLLCLNLSRDAVSRRTVARDLSLLQPLTVALFAGGEVEVTKGMLCLSVNGREKCSFQVDERLAYHLLFYHHLMYLPLPLLQTSPNSTPNHHDTVKMNK